MPKKTEYTNPELNHAILDMYDMSNAGIIIFTTQAVYEGCQGRFIFAGILGAIGVGQFIAGQIVASDATEHALKESVSKERPQDKVPLSHVITSRLCGWGYAVLAAGATNEVYGVVTDNFPRTLVGATAGMCGMGITALGAMTNHDIEHKDEADH